MSTDTGTSLTPTAIGLIGAYTSRLAELPAPEETWLVRDLPPALQDEGLRVKCRQAGIIEQVSYDDDANASRWRTNAQAYAQIQARVDATNNDWTLPCGHTGFRNPRDVDGIACIACGAVHDPEVIR